MSCCGAPLSPEDADAVSRLVIGRLAALLKTLRDNGFAVGLAEGRDAAALVEAGHAARPATLRSALKHLVSGRRRDWEAYTLASALRNRAWRLQERAGSPAPGAQEAS